MSALRVYGSADIEIVADLLSESNILVEVEEEGSESLFVEGRPGEIELADRILREAGYDSQIL